MADSYQKDQLPTTRYPEYHFNFAGDMNYQQLSTTRSVESNTYDRSKLLHTITSEMQPSIPMDLTDNGQSLDLDLEILMNETIETQVPFSNEWYEIGTGYDEIGLESILADTYSPPRPYWTVGTTQSDRMFDDMHFRAILSETYDEITTLKDSIDDVTPDPVTPSASSGRLNNLHESEEMVNMMNFCDQKPQKAVHTCATCFKEYPKRHLLNTHKKIHVLSQTCPFCSKQMARSRDMKRHIAVHERKHAKACGLPMPSCFLCPVKGCKGARNGFAREDHLRRHLKMAHLSKPT